MPSPPRLTAADAETLLVSAGFQYLERRGHHRIYGRDRTRLIVPFDGRPTLHPKAVRMIVQGIEQSRPAPSFEIDKATVGLSEGVPPPMEVESLTLDPPVPASPAPRAVRPAPAAAPRRTAPAPALPPPVPRPVPAAPPPASVPMVTPAQARPAAASEAAPPAPAAGEEEIELPRPKPKGVWS